MRNSAEFEQYVYQKSREKIKHTKLQRRFAVSAAAVCLIIAGGWGMMNTADKIPDSSPEQNMYNAVEYENKVTDSDLKNDGIDFENSVNSDYSDDYYKSSSGGDNLYENDGAKNFEENLPEDEVNSPVYFYDAVKYSENEYCLPHFAEIYKNGDLITTVTDSEDLNNICSSTLSQLNDSGQNPVSTSEKYTVVIGYNDIENTENVIIRIENQTVDINCGSSFALTENYLNAIKDLVNS